MTKERKKWTDNDRELKLNSEKVTQFTSKSFVVTRLMDV